MRSVRSATLRSAVALTVLAAACRHSPPPSGQAAPATDRGPGLPASLVAVLSQGEQAAVANLPTGPGQTLVEQNCLICHGAALIEQQRKDTTGWIKTVGLMRAWGSPIAADQVPVLIQYLSTHYGPAVATQ